MSLVSGQRGRNEHLSDEERADLRLDFRNGMSDTEAAIKYRCSNRVVSKYRTLWGCRKIRAAWDRADVGEGKNARPRMVEHHVFAPAPHMAPGITKEMLMGGRAPVAKLRRVE